MVTKDETTIVDGGGSKAEVAGARRADPQARSRPPTPTGTARSCRSGWPSSSGGVAVIKVGAATETELTERKHRIEDAVAATKAAVEEGIVPGGGSALVHVAKELDGGLGLTGDEATGVRDRPRGAGRPAALDRHQRRSRGRRRGVTRCASRSGATASTRRRSTYGNLVAAGVVDPVKVTRSAVANAASIARMVLTTESVRRGEEDEEAAGAGHGHGHGHGHGGM